MQLYFQPFYKLYGIRRLTQLMSPRLSSIPMLPRDSVVHYVSDDDASPNLDVSKPYFVGMGKQILVDYPDTLTSHEGNPTKQNTLIRPLVREFHLKNRNFKFSPDAISRVEDQTTLFALNYSFLDQAHRYAPLPLVDYYKFFNNYKTLFDKISTISVSKSKNHFIFVDLPKEVPSITLLNLGSVKMTKTIFELFPTHADLFILQFWHWLSDEGRENTIFGGLKKEDISKVNLVFHSEDGRSVVMNLGYIDSWLKGHESQEDSNESQKLKPADIQKLFLKFVMILKSRDPEEEVSSDAEIKDASAVDHEDEDELRDIRQEEQEYLTEHEEGDEGDMIDGHEYSDLANPASKNSILKPGNKKPVEDFKKRQELLDRDIDKSMVTSYSIQDHLKEIDKDITVLDSISSRRLKDKGIILNKVGEKIVLPPPVEDVPIEVIRDQVYKHENYNDALVRQINDHAEYGLVSASDYKKLLSDVDKYSKSLDPYGSHQLTIERMVVTAEDIKLDPNKTSISVSANLTDQTMAQSSLLAFDKDYLGKVIEKDMLAMVSNLQKSGIIIRRHEIEEDHSALGSYESHTIEFKPIDGKASVLRYRLPKVSEDGSFIANGNKYQLRKQRIDLPIRKTNPYTVALTSYYGKTFVQINQKKVNNSLAWLIKELNKAGMDDNHPYIKRVGAADVFDNNFKAPYIYNALANSFKTIITTKYALTFDHSDRENIVSPELLLRLEKGGGRVVGRTARKEPIVVTRGNNFEVFNGESMEQIGDIYQVLELPMQDAPLDFTEVKVFAKAVPVGIILGYKIGFKNLLRLLGAKHRIVEGKRISRVVDGQRVGDLASHEYVISFGDMKYIFDRRQTTATLILAGFTDYEKQLKQFEAAEFDRKDVYLNLLESKGLSALYIREIDLVQQLFIDPITLSILQQMNEPTTFNGLLLRSTEMLESYHHPDSQDMSAQRVRGYERFPGAVYKELVTQIRSFKNRNISGKSRVEMSPYQVWSSVMKDSAIKLVEDINPIQNLKESEIVTYVGNGGRNKDAINKESRAFHIEDMGVVSEATVDSSDVGVNAYLSANPNFEDMRGIIKSNKDFHPSNLLSTSSLLAPSANHDDAKRVNFISIQQSHTIAAQGYHQPEVRTGYEYVIANRTSDMFAFLAKEDGKVVSLNESGVIVEYKDGTQKGVTLGRSYGKAEGSVYPHDIVSAVTVGQTFKKGDPIAYNTGFFEKDFLNPKRILLKNSMTVKTVLLESNQTHEDASSISKDLGQRMRAKTTHVRSFTLEFTQNLINVVKIGQAVDPKSLLMIIEDQITSGMDVFDQQSLEVLKRLSNQAPKANYLGTIDKIEVFYHGDKRDMSASLKTLADRSDKLTADSCKSSGKPVITGRVNDDYRVGGTPLALDKAEVKIYITIETDAGVGDKGIFASQMKSVIGEVMNYDVHTEDGTKIDAMFGYRSIAARIVESPLIIGTTISLLRKAATIFVDIYRK